MNQKIKDFALQSGMVDPVMGEKSYTNFCHEKFAALIIEECIQCINNEIDRLTEYQNSLEDREVSKRNDVDLCVEKCYDNIEALKEHFGIE